MVLHGKENVPALKMARQLPNTEALKLPLLLFFMMLNHNSESQHNEAASCITHGKRAPTD